MQEKYHYHSREISDRQAILDTISGTTWYISQLRHSGDILHIGLTPIRISHIDFSGEGVVYTAERQTLFLTLVLSIYSTMPCKSVSQRHKRRN